MLKRLSVPSFSRASQRAALFFAALLIVCAGAMAGPPRFTNASRPILGILDPMMSLPVARSAEDVDAILSDSPSPDREVMRIKLRVGLVLIVSYLGLCLILASELAGRVRWGRWPAWALSSFAILTAAADFRENRALLRIVDLDLAQITPPMLAATRFDSVVKWALAATAMLLLAVFFLAARRGWMRAIGGIDVLAAAMLGWGSVHPQALDFAVIPLFAGLILGAVTLKFVTYESASRNPIPRSVR